MDVHQTLEKVMIGDWDFDSNWSDVKLFDAATKEWEGPKVRIREG